MDQHQTQTNHQAILLPVKLKAFAFFVALLMLALIFVYSAIGSIEAQIQKDTKHTLETVLESTTEALNIWIQSEKINLERLASEREISQETINLYQARDSKSDTSYTNSLSRLREYFTSLRKFNHAGFFVIDAEGYSLASARDNNIGTPNLIFKERPDLFQKVLNGETVWVPPLVSDVPLDSIDSLGVIHSTTMFIAVPIRNNEGRVISVLTERLKPEVDLLKILALGRVGQSGETYLVNSDGYMASESRFKEILARLGFLKDGQNSALKIRIEDPGHDLTQVSAGQPQSLADGKPLTSMAQSLTKKETSCRVTSYRDYRGVEVVGCWRWSDALGMGVVSEIDYSEAMGSYYESRNTIWSLFAVVVFLIVGSFLVFNRYNTKMSEFIIRKNRELESQVLERTAEIEAYALDLEREKETAEKLSKTKGEFLASMSHELRTPLNGVIGLQDLLTQTNLDENQAHLLNVANSSAHSLLSIVNDILDFSKIEAGKLDFEFIEYNLRELIEEVSHVTAMQAHQKGVDVYVDVTGVLYEKVVGDPTRLRQIFNNLLSNALKFTESGSITLKADLEHFEDGFELKCWVMDTGIGIPEDKIRGLFDLFTQADTSTTRKFGGTGLGLAISKKLSELMGGEISVHSQIGRGSVFCFQIHLGAPVTLVEVKPVVDISHSRILIIDQNKSTLEILESQFHQWDVYPVIAFDSITLKESLQKKQPYDFVYLNLENWSDQDLGSLKTSGLLDHAKLFVLSKEAASESMGYIFQLKVHQSIPQPITTAYLLNTLNYDSCDWKDNREAKIEKETIPGVRVLLVEDNKVNQMVARRMLKKLGIQVYLAENGQEAIDTLKLDWDFDLIFMDCQMPVMDGYEASGIIKSGEVNEHVSSIPIVAMTANAMVGDREKCINAGMNEFMSKPISKQKLKEMILKVLEK